MTINVKKTRKILLFALFIILCIALFACAENIPEPLYITIDGDISGNSVSVNLKDLEEISFDLTKDGATETLFGYELTAVLSVAGAENAAISVMFTATDGMSALIDIKDAQYCYVIEGENGLNIASPTGPRVLGIKELKEITLIKNENADVNFKIVNPDEKEEFSYGSSKLLLFKQSGGDQTLNGISAKKYIPEKFETDGYIYFEDFDIKKGASDGKFYWENGKLHYNGSPIIGIAEGAENIVYDAFGDMKSAVDGNKKVIAVLADGLSLEQVRYFSENLTLFKDNYKIAASVNPAISNVSLATILTGGTPKQTGTYERNIRKPDLDDIFDYVLGKGKTVKYVEGNGKLLLTNVPQILSLPIDGSTDYSVYENAKTALATNPDLLFVHFHGIDDINHAYSPLSAQALAKLLEVEGYLKSLTAGFTGTVIIVPDHGHVTVTEQGELKGTHGIFDSGDMFVPYYVIDYQGV